MRIASTNSSSSFKIGLHCEPQTQCGLCQSRLPHPPPKVKDLVLGQEAAYSGNALDAPNEADESHALSYVDIDTFLANF